MRSTGFALTLLPLAAGVRVPLGLALLPLAAGVRVPITRSASVRMAADKKTDIVTTLRSSLPTLGFGLLATSAASGLVDKVPRFFAGGISAPGTLDVLINVVLLAFAGQYLLKTLGVIGKVDYGGLEGLEVASCAREAGERALAGEVPTRSKDGSYEVATFAGGCFWGTELHFQRIPGVVATCVGYTQGPLAEPTYEQVCSGSTGHTEGLQLYFDPAVVTYELLVEKLLATVDPTALNRVGNDRGTQYRHGIYPHSEAQRAAAARVFEATQATLSQPIVTELKDATVFWPAEGYHQRYLQKGGQSAEKNAPEKVRCYG